VIGLTSLEILAAAEPDRPVVAVVDARRGEVFQQVFGCHGPDGPVAVGRPDELVAAVAGLVAVGDGADRYAEVYAAASGARVRAGRAPSAATMVALSAGRPAVEGRQVQPLYLRGPDVNVNVKTRYSPR
jgi:tRNA A37 threonylcarbamoyladenosine modification protein TsaB